MPRIGTRRVATRIALCALMLAAGCSSSDDSTRQDGSPTQDNLRASGPCATGEGESAARALLRCSERSVVFVETPYASGSGIVIAEQDEQYVLTNLHVVDPFEQATITLADGDALPLLPVTGVEAATDLALLGPIAASDLELTAVPLEPADVDKGDDVFIVGYPGTATADEVDLTITSGLVSRRRELVEWDQTYVQTDAVVEEGQSGGPMFAADGALVGVTALAFDDSFSLALDTADVAAAVRRILADGGDDVVLVPASADDGAAGGATSGTVEMPDDLELPTLFLPPSDEPRTWNLAVTGPTGRFGVNVVDATTGELLAASADGLALDEEMVALEASLAGLSVEEYAGPPPPVDPDVAAREVGPGTFRIEVAADLAAEVELYVAPDATPAVLQWTSDAELWPLTVPVPVQTLGLDEPLDLVLGMYQFVAGFDVELTQGDEVRMTASSPQGQVDLVVAEPGTTLRSAELNVAEDTPSITFLMASGGGLYGLDVDEVFTAPVTGTYRVLLENLDAFTIAARLEITLND